MTWSIMLGQFVAKFVRNLKPLTLFFVMTILPLLPSFLWFSVLFQLFESGYALSSGGQLVMLGVEAVRGSPMPERIENLFYLSGWIAVGCLMVFAVFNDISKFL